MSRVSRQEHDKVVARLGQAENALKKQGSRMRAVKAQIEALFSREVAGPPAKRGRYGEGAGGNSMDDMASALFRRLTPQQYGVDVEGFIVESMLDERASEILRQCTPDVQRAVVSSGGTGDARNPSAVVLARIKAAKMKTQAGGGGGGRGQDRQDVDGAVQQFVQENDLDEKSSQALLFCPPDVQQEVLSHGPLEGRNPSAMVMGRIKRAMPHMAAPMHQQDFVFMADEQAGNLDVASFITDNQLDEKSSHALLSASPDCQMAVLEQGPAAGRNSSAMVMGRIRKFQAGGLR